MSYDAFLSFYGPDTRRGFTNYLYHALLHAGIRPFREDGVLSVGEEIGPDVIEVIEQSKVAIPIISPNYASSRFCLDELLRISKRTTDRSIIPIFYHVSPSDVRHCQDSFRESIHRHMMGGIDGEVIDAWEQALWQIGGLEGIWISETGEGEANMVEKVVSMVLRWLSEVDIVVPDHLVGLDHHVREIMRKLDLFCSNEPSVEVLSEDVRFVGIWGMSGIGKTTLAQVVYNNIRHQYDCCSFLADIQERTKCSGLHSLQEQLVYNLLHTKPRSSDEVTGIVEHAFRNMKVLIVLDDVCNCDQVRAFAAEPSWFGQGSRIIITTRIRNVLNDTAAEVYELKPLENGRAVELFFKCAFRGDSPHGISHSLSHTICSALGGLPLAIEIVGSYLKGKDIEAWRMLAKVLMEHESEDGVMKEICDVLWECLRRESTKEIFLDVACFFVGVEWQFPSYMWTACQLDPYRGMDELCSMFLMKCDEKNTLWMHDIIRSIGRDIVAKENPEDPGKRSRLWSHKDALSTLKEGKGTEKVEALSITLDKDSDICFNSKSFISLPNLRFLKLDHSTLKGDFVDLLSNLRWLDWCGCPGTFEAKNLRLDKLVILDLSWSNVTEAWQGWKEIKMPLLKVLNLTGCSRLLRTPDLSLCRHLEILILEHCDYLVEIDPSILCLKFLLSLNLKFCKSLEQLPKGLGYMETLKDLLIDETPVKEIIGLIGEVELEALRSKSTLLYKSIPSPEGNLMLTLNKVKVFDKGSLYVERPSKKHYLHLTGKLVGIDHHVQKIMRKLVIGDENGRVVDVHAVQICGNPGVGKTTLAKAVYNKLRHFFPYCTFLSDIREVAKQKRILTLQEQLVSDLHKREFPKLNSFEEGIDIIKHRFRCQRVLIVLDDVDSSEQINAFARKLNWFGPGSKIIVTTRKRQRFLKDDKAGLVRKYVVEQMSDDEALLLFNKHAIRGCPLEDDYHYLPKKIISVIGRTPLSIEIVASYLYTKRMHIALWEEALKLLESMPHGKIEKALMVIYADLDEDMKNMFLDVACFFIGKDKRIAKYMWEALGLSSTKIEHLFDMSLVKIQENNDLWMHDKIIDFGRKVSRKECIGGRSRLWNYEDALSLIKKGKDAEKVTAISLGSDNKPTQNFTCEEFHHLPNLRFLKLANADIRGNFSTVLSNLRWLDWQECPETFEALNLQLDNLVILNLSRSKLNQHWKGWSELEMLQLKVLNLTGCSELLVTPNFSGYPHLEMLILEDCFRLVKIDPSICSLKYLVSLNLRNCCALNILPEALGHLQALEELQIDGTNVKDIPSSIGGMKRLKTLSASSCFSLSHLPSSICCLTALSSVSLDTARIIQLPDSICNLVRLRKLSLRDCQWLGKLPDSIGKLGPSLEELDVSGTGISQLPDSISNLQGLRVLRMDSCFIREFPNNIWKLSKMEEIHASWCRSLEGPVPSDIAKLRRLKVLRLRGSSVSSLPPEIKFLSCLQTLDLLHCNMKELPMLPSSLTELHLVPHKSEIIEPSESLPGQPSHLRRLSLLQKVMKLVIKALV